MANENETTIAKAPPAPKCVAEHHYVVREPFGDYRKGHRLTDADIIDAVHGAGHAAKLIRVPVFVEA